MKPIRIVLILLMFLLITFLAYFMLNNKDQTQQVNQDNSTPDIPITDKDNTIIHQSQTIIYKDPKYGFQLNLPESWKGYVIAQSSDYFDPLVATAFCFPTNESGWSTTGCPKGYFSIFYYRVYTKSEWAEVTKEEGPGVPSLLGEGPNFVVGYKLPQDGPSDIPASATAEEFKVINSFSQMK